MTTITELGTVMQELLTSTADKVGRESGFIRRQRKLSGSSYAQALVFGWMSNPGATLSELSQAAATVGTVVSKQGLDERFSEASARFMGELLQRAVGQLVEGEAVRVGIFANFSQVHVLDSTSIRLPEALRDQWPGCNAQGVGSSALKVSVDWELVQGRLAGIHVQAGKAHDQHSPLAAGPLPAQAIWLRDLGYFNLKTFARLQGDNSYFLSRLKVNCRLYTLDGQPFDWVNFLVNRPDDQVDCAVLAGAERVACRLVAWRVPPEVTAQRQQQLDQQALDHARPVSPVRAQTVAWSIYITNAPADRLSLAQAQVLARVRWQIELLFKLWKSDGLLDEWRTVKPWRALTECLAKLLALLLQHWCMLLGAWPLPNRSLHQAIQLLRKQAFHLASVLRDFDRLCLALASIQTALTTCQMCSLRSRPHTFQLLARAVCA